MKAYEVQDIDAACKLSTEEEEDAKKAAAGKDVITYLMSTEYKEDAKKAKVGFLKFFDAVETRLGLQPDHADAAERAWLILILGLLIPRLTQ